MSSTYEAELEISSIGKHPNNPRRKAVADEGLVQSVAINGLIEPLVVVPQVDAGVLTGYLLIAGHRRLDACKKAKHTTAPAIVRNDLVTPGQQLEAMLVENDNREDLTPIEQAEGYQQLALDFGYTQKAIAQAVGKDPKTVRDRLKLLKLRKPTQTKIHTGQLSLDHALALVEFADDAAATKRLESALTTSYGNFPYALQQCRRHKKEAAEVQVRVDELKAGGAKEYSIPKGGSIYHLTDGATRTSQVGVPDENHTDCLAYTVVPADTYNGPVLHTICTDPARHTDQLDVEQQRRVAERDQEDAERDARQAATDDARALRIKSVEALVRGAGMPNGLRTVVRALLPVLLQRLADEALTAYLDALDVRDDDRWTNRWYESQTKVNAPKLTRHITDIDRWSDSGLTSALATALAVMGDDQYSANYSRIDVLALRYQELLEQAEHPFCDIDDELAAKITTDEAAAS